MDAEKLFQPIQIVHYSVFKLLQTHMLLRMLSEDKLKQH